MSYFLECYNIYHDYVEQVTKFELEWLLTTHEHLNVVDDYARVHHSPLELLATTILPQNQSSKNGQEESDVHVQPEKSINFIENLKNSLIVSLVLQKFWKFFISQFFPLQSHEQNIEQVTTILNELRNHATILQMNINLEPFLNEFTTLHRLRYSLVDRLRSKGYTVFAAMHQLLKQAYSKLKSYQAFVVAAEAANAPSTPTGSASNSPGGHQGSLPSSTSPTLQQCALMKIKYLKDLALYYTVCGAEFRRWLTLEAYIVEVMCGQSQSGGASSRAASPIFKLTIKRVEVSGSIDRWR